MFVCPASKTPCSTAVSVNPHGGHLNQALQTQLSLPSYEALLVENQVLRDDNVRLLQEKIRDGERIASLEQDIRSLKLCLCSSKPGGECGG